MDDLITRLVLTAALGGLGLAGYWAWTRWQLWRLQPSAGGRAAARAPGLETWEAGRPAVLYFTTPDCAPCRTMQRPALARLQAELGLGLQVIEIDAAERPAVADHWGVLSVPTTFILDAAGAPRHVNHGVAGAEKLKRQIAEGSGPRPKGKRVKHFALDL